MIVLSDESAGYAKSCLSLRYPQNGGDHRNDQHQGHTEHRVRVGARRMHGDGRRTLLTVS
jgi:hypothetical protein